MESNPVGQVPEGTCGVQGGRLSLGSEKVPPFLVVFFSCVQCVPGPVLGRGHRAESVCWELGAQLGRRTEKAARLLLRVLGRAGERTLPVEASACSTVQNHDLHLGEGSWKDGLRIRGT